MVAEEVLFVDGAAFIVVGGVVAAGTAAGAVGTVVAPSIFFLHSVMLSCVVALVLASFTALVTNFNDRAY